ncbi:esterase-like activity of phytase family protein [Acanthopleuribacter pedis]|uniref:Esterase-like activity of phytase family protein n=1 Tax=Acanthopleuribacter pedis TaxID=442870 RepID=A0A8J7PZ12_9BACT|nr:esterase-like activity of phytase family protein [Acanthopleuribacter pedis]MBO1317287.1 esterase-like activity of phytase family protein [Acanthopleuribacter pedis]MBO1318594.1 esterase-like activity of phytase family protein [Acanthopleuribacter pedis]
MIVSCLAQSARRLLKGLATVGLVATATLPALAQEPILRGRAVLPADSFAAGPYSGFHLGGTEFNGKTAPFRTGQPVQGFSSVLRNADGTYQAMSDNGFGGMENSADYILRVYHIRPNFKTERGGDGDMDVLGFFNLSDPDRHIPFTITHHFTDERLLTGADFDIESFVKAADGTYWFGDEFGPFLLHTDASGRLLEAPIPLPDFENPGQYLQAPQNPHREEASAVRMMNAVRHHARMHGNTKTPVFSPWHVMFADDDETTHIGNRANPPAGSGLTAADSEIFNVQSLQRAGYPVVCWTVNDKARMLDLMALGVDGIISDRPDLLWEAVQEFDADGDGTPGDFLDAHGLIDLNRFDAQGHRGGRNLRPENTIPAVEVALDNMMTTLELDCGVTADGIPVLGHDPYLSAAKVRRVDGASYEAADEILLKDITATDLQNQYVADKLFRGPEQLNDPALSPAGVGFFGGEEGIYKVPTLQQVFDFVEYYICYYSYGPGTAHPQAEQRRRNARRVRFNIETKTNPRTDRDPKGNVYIERTHPAIPFADAVAEVIKANHMTERADIQSFDFHTLLQVQAAHPTIRTVYLFGDFPIYANGAAGSDDGTNLQDQAGANTPWLAGMLWPYRVNEANAPARVRGSGGFEGMAMNPEGTALFPMLEKPLTDASGKQLLIHRFDLATKTFTGEQYTYELEPEASAIGEFIMYDPRYGLVIERDGSQGDLNGFKKIYQVQFPSEGNALIKTEVLDLLNIRDAAAISAGNAGEARDAGDVGVGETFAFPFVTIESVVFYSPFTLGIINDNNYPFSVGRHIGSGAPDDNEFVIVRLPQPLAISPNTAKSNVDPLAQDTY